VGSGGRALKQVLEILKSINNEIKRRQF